MFFMGSTNIKPEKTAAEIQGLLGYKGAHQILMEYENREIVAVSFTLRNGNQEIPFRLPVRWEACLQAMLNDPGTPMSRCNKDQAKRTAWRIILRWVQAQIALIDTEMVTMTEVMLPYIQVGKGTFYEALEKEHFKMLPDLRKE